MESELSSRTRLGCDDAVWRSASSDLPMKVSQTTLICSMVAGQQTPIPFMKQTWQSGGTAKRLGKWGHW